MNRHVFLVLVSVGLGSFACQLEEPTTGEPSSSIVFIVRHAEKVDTSTASPLTAEGHARGELLADMLRDAGIEQIYSSDFVRTRETAAPLARRLALEVELYDATALPELAEKLKRAPAVRVLVVGHSNTTPDVVALLGGDPVGPIADNEYDRLYVVYLGADRSTSTLLRFGAPAQSNP